MPEELNEMVEWLNPHRDSQGMELVTSLDERAFDEGRQRSRSYTGPLTAADLSKILEKPRFPKPPEPLKPDSQRRLIFITNLDRLSVTALLNLAKNHRYLNHLDRLTVTAPLNINPSVKPNALNHKSSLATIRCLEIDGSIKGVPVFAFPDTGSCINTVSEDFTKQHNIKVDRTRTISVRLPKGNSIETVGTALAEFKFKAEETVYNLKFDVMKQSVWDVVLSERFLTETKTLTEHRSCIHERLRPCIRSGNRLCLLGQTGKDGIPCSVNGQPARALPDTGSDLMLISGDFARRNNFRVHRGKRYRRYVEFTDGSTAQTDGTVIGAELELDLPPMPPDAEFDYIDYLRNAENLLQPSRHRDQSTFICDLHVMDGLPCDIILGRQFIFDNSLFHRLDQLPHAEASHLGIETNTSGALEEIFCFIREKTKPFLKRLRASFFQAQSQHGLDPTEGPQTWEDFRREEEDRRDRIDAHINALLEPQKTLARGAESRRREKWQDDYPPPPLLSPLNASLEPP